MRQKTVHCILTAIILTASLIQAQDNWPHWRGPNHNGIVAASDLPTTWSSSENIIWKTPLPHWSAATPIIWDGQIFIISPSASSRNMRGYPGGAKIWLMSISRKDGKILWQSELDNRNQLYNKHNNATPSPVTDGKMVWTMTGTGIVTAFDMKGNRIWKRDIQQDYGPFGLNFGYGSSPLLVDGNLFIEVLHGFRTDDPSYILSLDGQSGKTLWHQERPTDALRESPDAYTTPALLNYNGEIQIVISGADYVTGHNPETGKEIWRSAGTNPLKRTNYRVVSSPIIVDGIIYAPTRQRPLTALLAGGVGDITESHIIWKWDAAGAPDVPSPVCDGTYFYMVDDAGRVTCLDAKKGTRIWGPESTIPGTVSASPVLADGKMYILNEGGITTVVTVEPEFKILAVNQLDNSYTLASPAISGSQLFIRTASYLYCIGR